MGEDLGGRNGGGVGEAIVDEADGAIASGLVGAFDVNFVFSKIALVGGNDEG